MTSGIPNWIRTQRAYYPPQWDIDGHLLQRGVFDREGLAGPTGLTSDVLITGGDLTVNGVRDFSNNKVNVFNPGNNTLTASGTMNYPRWYPSITTLRNGDKLVLVGRPSPSEVGNLGKPSAEVFDPGSGWKALPGIAITDGIPGALEWLLSKRLRRYRWRGESS